MKAVTHINILRRKIASLSWQLSASAVLLAEKLASTCDWVDFAGLA